MPTDQDRIIWMLVPEEQYGPSLPPSSTILPTQETLDSMRLFDNLTPPAQSRAKESRPKLGKPKQGKPKRQSPFKPLPRTPCPSPPAHPSSTDPHVDLKNYLTERSFALARRAFKRLVKLNVAKPSSIVFLEARTLIALLNLTARTATVTPIQIGLIITSIRKFATDRGIDLTRAQGGSAALVAAWAKAGRVDIAVREVHAALQYGGNNEKERKDIVGALIVGLADRKLTDAAAGLLSRIAGLKSHVPYMAVIAAFAKPGGSMDRALEVYRTMVTSLHTTKGPAIIALIHGYALRGNVALAERWFNEIPKHKHLSHTTGSYNAMLRAHSVKGDAKSAGELYRTMQESNIEPSISTYAHLIRSTIPSADVATAQTWLNASEGVSLNHSRFDLHLAMMEVHCAAGQVEEGWKSLNDALSTPHHGFPHLSLRPLAATVANDLDGARRRILHVPLRHRGTVVAGLMEAFSEGSQPPRPDVAVTLYTMLGSGVFGDVALDARVHSFAVDANVRTQDMEAARRAFDAISDAGKRPSTPAYVALVSGYGRVGDRDGVRRMERMMEDNDVVKTVPVYEGVLEALLGANVEVDRQLLLRVGKEVAESGLVPGKEYRAVWKAVETCGVPLLVDTLDMGAMGGVASAS
ncbi:hypothetical protein HKX48_003699 [Thoreauomyces humboldtii]|nr:hypothetical protein HKX48_003699 [Thoreauomyces humboldtii]